MACYHAPACIKIIQQNYIKKDDLYLLKVFGCQAATRDNKNTDHGRPLHIHLQPCSCFEFYRQVCIFQKYFKKPNIIIYNKIIKFSHL